ncbi:hypothetical protein B296_00052854 [Ensete ventricosum]|uniref:Uncharacterized protein n=1 Tax=Ensete ventricosum TaxID=4639 RepID=A0A426XFC9_ENSVE|nr:hypothetical protein B296_00052854 [Ensete ventricosum]
MNSNANPRDLAERVNSGTNFRDLVEKVNSGTNLGDLVEKVNSSTNPGDLTEKVNSGMNPEDLTEKFGRARHVHHGGCSGGRSPVSTSSAHRRVFKMVEDLPQPGSAQLVALPRRVSGRVPRGRDYLDLGLVYDVFLTLQESGRLLSYRLSHFWVSGVPSNNKGWKSRYLFVSGPVWGFRLDWSAHPIDNASPYLSEEEFVLVGRLKGILSSS